MDLKETFILGDAIDHHWYYRSKSKAMKQLIENVTASKILDIGAGSGFFSKQILMHSSAKEATCVDISYEFDKDDLVSNKVISFRRSVEYYEADLVLLMDVLEHVDDDIGLLQSYIDKVPSGAHFLISVPAFQFLWSTHDIYLEHKRRYRLEEIESIVGKSGLNVLYGKYYFGMVFPLAAIVRLFEKLKFRRPEDIRSQLQLHHPLINSALTSICDAELSILKNNRFAGLTAFVLAVKS